ncbi:MAG: hypothetical protein ABMA26_27075 [Limisphaerales bacterium]
MNHPLSLAPGFSRVSATVTSGNRLHGFRFGKPLARSVSLLPLLILASGCIVFPRTEVAAPTATGAVVDASTSVPLAHAHVSRRVAVHDKHTTVQAESTGKFHLKQSRFFVWLPPVCWAPTDIQYRVECPGYASFTTNLLGGGSFVDGRKAHDLGRVALERNSR